MHPYPGDVAGVAQPDVLPGAAAVGRLVDAVAVGDVAADAGLAGADIDDVGVGLADGDSADRGALEVAVGDVLPGHPAVGGLPDPASAGAEVERHRVGRVPGDRDHPAAAVRADQAKAERLREPIDGMLTHRNPSLGSSSQPPDLRISDWAWPVAGKLWPDLRRAAPAYPGAGGCPRLRPRRTLSRPGRMIIRLDRCIIRHLSEQGLRMRSYPLSRGRRSFSASTGLRNSRARRSMYTTS
ncbi:hypothetical protein HRbin26_01805 [bacterium HR26]|nr:hypothetical protein HRbin26_01805 [bacterium HR26]